MNKDKTLRRIFSKIGNRHGVTADDVEDMYRHFWKEALKKMNSDELKEILIHNFGRFLLMPGKLRSAAKALGKECYKDAAERCVSTKNQRKRMKKIFGDEQYNWGVEKSKRERGASK